MTEVAINIVVGFVTLVGYGYLFVRQFLITIASRDSVTPLRAIVLAVFTLAIITLIPVLAYQVHRATGTTDENLRSIVTVLSPVNRLATLALLIVFVNYRIKE